MRTIQADFQRKRAYSFPIQRYFCRPITLRGEICLVCFLHMSYSGLQSHWHAAEAPTGTGIFSHIIRGRGLFLKTRRGDLRVLTVLDWNVWLFPRLWLRDTGFSSSSEPYTPRIFLNFIWGPIGSGYTSLFLFWGGCFTCGWTDVHALRCVNVELLDWYKSA